MIIFYLFDFFFLSRRKNLPECYRYEPVSQERALFFKMAKTTTAFLAVGFFDTRLGVSLDQYFSRYQVLNLNELQGSVLYFILLLLLVDFLYWITHLLVHRYRFLFWFHRPHHINRSYTLSIHFRDSFIGWIPFFLVRTIFCSLLGFSLRDTFAILIIHNHYMHFLHCSLPKIKFLEYFVITPSAHRVHHSIESYGGKSNFGTVFVIWDKLFKTYKEEPGHELLTEFGVKGFEDKSVSPFMEAFGAGKRGMPEAEVNWSRLQQAFALGLFALASLNFRFTDKIFNIDYKVIVMITALLCIIWAEFRLFGSGIIKYVSSILLPMVFLGFIWSYAKGLVWVDFTDSRSLMSLVLILIYSIVTLEKLSKKIKD